MTEEIADQVNIAVVIPVYNRSETLVRALRSVIGQTRPADQIVVIDDGSKESSQNYIRSLNEFLYTPLQFIKLSQNRGVSAARNAGITYALQNKADYIAFLDSDDEWKPNKIDEQLKELKKTKLLVCHSNEVWMREGKHLNQHKKHKKSGGRIFIDSICMCSMSPSTVILHKSVLLDVGLFDEDFVVCEDYDLWLRVTRKFEVAFIEDALTIKHGGHADQLSMRFKGMDYFRILALKKLKNMHSSELSTEENLILDEWITKRTDWLGPHFDDMAQGKMTLRNT